MTEQQRARPGRRERKKREVRRRIRRAAARLFAEKGYDATTVDEIAEQADVAKGTFFNHFPRKDALLTEMIMDSLEAVEEALGPPDTWTGSRRSQLLRFFMAMGEQVHREPTLFKVVGAEHMRDFWVRGEQEPERQLRELTMGLLERAVEEGEFPGGGDLMAASRLLEAAYGTTTIESLRAGAPLDAYRADLTTRFNIIFRGLGGEPVRLEGIAD